MSKEQIPFGHSLLPFVATTLAAHRNPATCLLFGVDRPLIVRAGEIRLESDMFLVRPGVEHSVEIGGRAKVLYFDGLEFPFGARVAAHIPREISSLAIDALDGCLNATLELRSRFAAQEQVCPPEFVRIIQDIVRDPMNRMSQLELANRTGLERTRALRKFKELTGMTFRAFKNWIGLQAAARQIADGDLIRTAAMVAGFSDSAHLTRTFRQSFGITPSAATVDRLH